MPLVFGNAAVQAVNTCPKISDHGVAEMITNHVRNMSSLKYRDLGGNLVLRYAAPLGVYRGETRTPKH
jgi:hypothetical protein